MISETFILNNNEAVTPSSLLNIIINDLNAFTLNSFFRLSEITTDFKSLIGIKHYNSDSNTLKIQKDKNDDFQVDFSGEGMFLKLKFERNELASNGVIHYTNDIDNHPIVKSNLAEIEALIKTPECNKSDNDKDVTPELTKNIINKLDKEVTIKPKTKDTGKGVAIRRVFLKYRLYYLVEFTNYNVVLFNAENSINLLEVIRSSSKAEIIDEGKTLKIGKYSIPAQIILDQSKNATDLEVKSFCISLGMNHKGDTQVGFHYAPFGDNEFIGISEFSGYGSHESGGFRYYNTHQIELNENLRATIESCDGKWLIDLINKKASQKEIRDAIKTKLNQKF